MLKMIVLPRHARGTHSHIGKTQKETIFSGDLAGAKCSSAWECVRQGIADAPSHLGEFVKRPQVINQQLLYFELLCFEQKNWKKLVLKKEREKNN